MATFQIGETVVCEIEVKDSDGTLTNPADSMTISIYDPQNTAVVTDGNMTKDSTGCYHYDYLSASTALHGEYRVRYTADDGTRITIGIDTFRLED